MSARGIRFSDNRFSFRWGIIPFFRRIRLPELDFSEPRESRAGLEFKALQQYALKIPQSLGPPGCKACGSIMSRGVHGAVAGHSELLGAGQVSPYADTEPAAGALAGRNQPSCAASHLFDRTRFLFRSRKSNIGKK